MACARSPGRRSLLAFVAALAALALGAPTAMAADLGWSGVQVLSSQGQPGTNPRLAVNAAGQAVIAWNETDAQGNSRVRVRFRQPGDNFANPTGAFSDSGPVYASAAGASASGASVAIDSNGNALVSWTRSGEVEVASGTPGGGLGSPQNLTPEAETASGGGVAMDPQGNAIVGWVRGSCCSGPKPRVQARFKPAGGSFGATTNVFDSATAPGVGAEPLLTSPLVAMDEQGNAAFAWAANLNSFNQDRFTYQIWAAYRPAGGSFEAAHSFPYAGGERSASPTSLAMRSGATLLARDTDSASDSRVIVNSRPPGGPWSDDNQTLSEAPPSGEVNHSFGSQMAFDSSGNVLATWSRSRQLEGGEIYESWRPAGASGFDARKAITPPTPPNGSPSFGFDQAGNAVMAWTRRGPLNSDTDQAIATTRSPGRDGTLGALQPISAPGDFDQGRPALKVSSAGNAIAAWVRTPASGDNIVRTVEVREVLAAV